MIAASPPVDYDTLKDIRTTMLYCSARLLGEKNIQMDNAKYLDATVIKPVPVPIANLKDSKFGSAL
jgi:hypothetical protein